MKSHVLFILIAIFSLTLSAKNIEVSPTFPTVDPSALAQPHHRDMGRLVGSGIDAASPLGTFGATAKSTIETDEIASHEPWNQLLKKYVTPQGNVNYKGFKAEKAKLQSYLDYLSKNQPAASASKNERLAYWINVYNAFTVKLIVDNYPLKSIMDLDKPWDTPFIKIGSKTYSLNNIEHDIIRKRFNEPRIHFAVNCASVSCPILLNEAYTATKLNAQLDKQTRAYINNPRENAISANKAEISSIFDWYKGDFTKSGSLIGFLNKYSRTKIQSSASISHKNYNWNLNE